MHKVNIHAHGDAAYFDSVDDRTPPRWLSTSLSRSQTALAHLNEVVLQTQIVSSVSSQLVVSSVVLACDFK